MIWGKLLGEHRSIRCHWSNEHGPACIDNRAAHIEGRHSRTSKEINVESLALDYADQWGVNIFSKISHSSNIAHHKSHISAYVCIQNSPQKAHYLSSLVFALLSLIIMFSANPRWGGIPNGHHLYAMTSCFWNWGNFWGRISEGRKTTPSLFLLSWRSIPMKERITSGRFSKRPTKSMFLLKTFGYS